MVYFSSYKGVKTIGKKSIQHLDHRYNTHCNCLWATQAKYPSVYIWRHIHISLRTGITVLKTAAGSWASISKSCSVITEKMYLCICQLRSA